MRVAMRVAIRTDASNWIGTGHVVRCATLAEVLRSEGVEVSFLSRTMPGDQCDWLAGQGFDVQRLSAATKPASAATGGPHAFWLGVTAKQDAHESASVIAERGGVDWLIVDHYGLDAEWERSMRAHCRALFVIDDLADRPHDCDALLDQNLVADLEMRYEGRVSSDCRCMLGPRFALLQADYLDWRARVSPRKGLIQRLLVFFGGVDAANLTGRTLNALMRIGRTNLTVDVVVGGANPHREAIPPLVVAIPGAHLYTNLPSLAPLMATADLAIGAGGATSWERCCLGLPALIVTVAANQVPIARELHAQGLAHWLGSVETLHDSDLENALRKALEGEGSEERSRRCMAVVDGGGTPRVASVLRAASNMELRLRAANQGDKELLLEWANDPVVRQHAFSSARIEPEAHEAWFRTRLADQDHCRIYIAESPFGIPVGQVRFELGEAGWLIGYSIDALFRRQGLGQRLLGEALRHLVEEMGPCVVVGRVKNDNPSSLKVFGGLGFLPADLGDNVTEFRLALSLARSDRGLPTPSSVGQSHISGIAN